jgi:hypothetical protein
MYFLLSILNGCAVLGRFTKNKFEIVVKFTFEAVRYSDKLDLDVVISVVMVRRYKQTLRNCSKSHQGREINLRRVD